MAANGLKTKAYKCLFSSHWQPFNFGWSNCLSLKHVSWLLSFSILPNIFRILAILFQKLAKTGGLEWLSHYNCRFNMVSGIVREGCSMSSWMNGGGDSWSAWDTRNMDIFNVCNWGSTNSRNSARCGGFR